MYMLCRNRVHDYAKWKAVFDANAPAGREAGLETVNVWRDIENPNNVFFLLKVADIDQARAFLAHPDAAKSGEVSGVIDGEYHFVESARGH